MNTAQVFVVLVLAYALVFTFASAFIAGMKNRSEFGYGLLGFFLGFIGLLIAAAVPKAEEQLRVRCRYIVRTSSGNRFIPCILLLEEGGILHVSAPNNRSFSVPIASITSTDLRSRKALPPTFPDRQRIIGQKATGALEQGRTPRNVRDQVCHV
jgi:hypothetical protein